MEYITVVFYMTAKIQPSLKMHFVNIYECSTSTCEFANTIVCSCVCFSMKCDYLLKHELILCGLADEQGE